jgi:hypothetical protein
MSAAAAPAGRQEKEGRKEGTNPTHQEKQFHSKIFNSAESFSIKHHSH